MEDAQEETHFRQKKSAQKICPRKLVGLRRSGAGSRGAERSGGGGGGGGLNQPHSARADAMPKKRPTRHNRQLRGINDNERNAGERK